MVSKIVDDMQGSISLIAARLGVDSVKGESTTALKHKLALSVATKVGHLTAISPNEAKHILEVAKSVGYDKSGLDIVVAAVDTKLEALLDDEGDDKPPSQNNQICKNSPAWITETILASLRNKRLSIDAKISIIAEWLAVKLGCTHPSERSKGDWLTLVLMLHFEVWPRYQVVYDYLQTLKREIIAHRQKYPFPKLTRFPRVPTELPDRMFTYIFGDDPPTVVQLERFEATTKHVPLRKNSKLISAEKKRDTTGTPQPSQMQLPSQPMLPSKIDKPDESTPPSWALALLAQQAVKAEPLRSDSHVKREPTKHEHPLADAAPSHGVVECKWEAPSSHLLQSLPSGLQPRGLLRTMSSGITFRGREAIVSNVGLRTTALAATLVSRTGNNCSRWRTSALPRVAYD